MHIYTYWFYFYSICRLPEDRNVLPTLSNGHVGYTVFSDSVYMNGLYNGLYGLSHRARIPNYASIQFSYEKQNISSNASYILNVKAGTFQTILSNEDVILVHLNYPHRFYTRAIVNEVKIYRQNYEGKRNSFNLVKYN